jgi:Ca-activated chloride channel family protein
MTSQWLWDWCSTRAAAWAKIFVNRVWRRKPFETANPEDEFLLVEFSDAPTLAVPLINDAHQTETRPDLTKSKGKTALLDAIDLGLTEIKKSKKSRRALLVISDGGENHSRCREKKSKISSVRAVF